MARRTDSPSRSRTTSNARPRRTPDQAERRRDPQRTRERIVEAALAEFSAKGFAGARVSEIAERAGLNKQLISYYFGGKAGLYQAILARWQEGEDAVVAGQQDQSLADLTTSYVARIPRDRDLARLLAWEGLSPDSGDAGGEHRTARMRQALEDLGRRQRAGELAGDLDPRCFLLAFMAAATAPATLPQLARSIFDADPDSEEFAQHYADQLARMIEHLSGE
ncbi:TetR/AcrR family transcriptional regulator [Actinopolymorpha alba]|uniref:TetR/AcrR family transcriptional regulator n=1 Tax=Actinopolymorpha alba TaxID=533267 RepID=UPI0003AAD123|nr:TetR/AcrR family transcriptional regulator [Actinopolymorpha alba]